MNYSIVGYAPEFREEVISLAAELWGRDLRLSRAYFEWKYEGNPYLPAPLIYLALYEGRVVGMRGLYGSRWEFGSPSCAFSALCAGDLVIAPGHRNRGLVTRILDAAAQDADHMHYSYLLNLSAGPATQLASLRSGWRGVGPLEVVRRTGSAGWFAQALCRVATAAHVLRGQRAGNPFAALDATAFLRASRRPIRLAATPRPDAMAGLIKRIGTDGRIRHARDLDFFRWRFNNPLSRYRLLIWEDRSLDGYLVLQARAGQTEQPVNIVDWEGTTAQVRADLLKAAIAWGRFEEMRIWSGTLPADTRQVLQEHGFRPLATARTVGEAFRLQGDRSMVLLRHAHSGDWKSEDRSLLDLRRWDLRMIYSDGF